MKKWIFFLFVVSLTLFTGSGNASQFEKVLKLEPGIKDIESKNYDKAIEFFKKCVEREGEKGYLASACAFFLGRAYYEKEKYQEAINHLKNSLDVAIKAKNEGREIDVMHAVFGTIHYWLGMAYYNNNQYKEAIISFNRALEKAVEDPQAEFAKDWQKYSQMRVVQFWMKYYAPLFPSKYACYFRLGSAYYFNKQYEEATNAYQKAVELNPKVPDLYTNMAAAYRELKRYDEAIVAVKKSIEIEPNAFAYNVLASLYLNKKQYDEAIVACEKAIELEPKNLSHYKALSDIYAAREDFSNAITVAKRALEISPDNPNVLIDIARFSMMTGKFDDAIASLNRSITLLKTPVLKTNFGIIIIQGDYPVLDAVAEGADLNAGDKIISINGQSTKGLDLEKIEQMLRETKNEQILLTLGRKGMNKPLEKKFNIKREEIAQVWKVSGSIAGPFAMRSLVYALKGDYEKASKDAETAYSLNPDEGWSKSARCYSYIIAGKPDEAIKILSTIKESPFDRLLECLAYAKKGDLNKSLEIYASIPEDYLMSKNALRQYFKNAVLESLSSYVESKKENIKALESNGQYREALKEYAELLKIADQTKRKEILGHVAALLKEKPYLMELPEEARKYALRAEVMTKEGKFAEAVKEYKEAIKIAPFNPVLYKAIALNYAELKDYKKAIENMNTYIELYPDASDVRAAKDEIYKWEFMMVKEGK